MSTRAMVGIRNNDDTITYIYNHYDGHPSEVGLTLHQHYKTEQQVRELIAFGNTRRVEPVPYDMIGKLADTMGTDRLSGLMNRIGAPAYKRLSDTYMEPLDGGAETTDAVSFERLLGDGIDWLYLFAPDSRRWWVKRAGWAWIALPDAVRMYAGSMVRKANRSRLSERAAECGIEL